jgi:exo-beta-1,3-glucanase (GH17 family)
MVARASACDRQAGLISESGGALVEIGRSGAGRQLMETPDEGARHGSWIGAASGRRQNMPIVTVILILCLVAGLHLAVWGLAEPRIAAADFGELLSSVSYNRFAKPSSVDLGVSEARIRADLTAIAKQAKAVRTYASTQGPESVPAIAAELGLTVTLSVWIDKDEARNAREIDTALDLARRNRNVTRLVVGNETVFRHEHTAAALAEIVRRVKRDSPVAVATADNWKTFLDHPELVDAVDQAFAHIIPYWEGLPKKSAVEGSIAIYDRLRAAYPGKKIVIGEFGWPSAGHNYERAVPSPFKQAGLLRDFVAQADALGIDYNIVEAIDQPEKSSRVMSDPIGASSMRRCGPNLRGPGRL